jgi:hypothetical protein
MGRGSLDWVWATRQMMGLYAWKRTDRSKASLQGPYGHSKRLTSQSSYIIYHTRYLSRITSVQSCKPNAEAAASLIAALSQNRVAWRRALYFWEEVGFEPTRPLRACRVSSAVPSTTQPLLQYYFLKTLPFLQYYLLKTLPLPFRAFWY